MCIWDVTAGSHPWGPVSRTVGCAFGLRACGLPLIIYAQRDESELVYRGDSGSDEDTVLLGVRKALQGPISPFPGLPPVTSLSVLLGAHTASSCLLRLITTRAGSGLVSTVNADHGFNVQKSD